MSHIDRGPRSSRDGKSPTREIKRELLSRPDSEEESERDFEHSWEGKGSSVGTDERGFSTAALRFYRATGRALPLPDYSGVSSEAAYLAWKRGVERHFRTYRVTKESEQVLIAADLLSGEARNWWNGLWIASREGEVAT